MNPRSRSVQILLALCAMVILALTGFGISAGELALLERILGLTSNILIGILGWAIGRYSPRPTSSVAPEA